MFVYVDGGCSGNPGPGGWAYVLVDPAGNVMEEKWGAEKNTTNNRMELTSVIKALEALKLTGQCGQEIKVFTDSQYVQKGMSQWIKDWKARGWKTAGKDPVKNQDLWRQLDELSSGFTIAWHWVKGHAGNTYNERCDSLTQTAIKSIV